MKRKRGSEAPPASTSSVLGHSMWVLLTLAGVVAVVAVVFRASLSSSASSVEGSQPVTRAAEFAAFARTIPNTIAVRAAEEFPPSQKSGSMNLDQVMEMLCSGATGGK